jgi:hypothetical protein
MDLCQRSPIIEGVQRSMLMSSIITFLLAFSAGGQAEHVEKKAVPVEPIAAILDGSAAEAKHLPGRPHTPRSSRKGPARIDHLWW